MVRRFLRRIVPAGIRLQVTLLRRWMHDRTCRERFAERRAGPDAFPHMLASYSLPIIDYPGQEATAAAKRANQRLLANALDGVVLAPRETWSLWRLAGEPTVDRGYAPAAAIRGGVLTREVGGATCLLSTVVYNAALLAGLEIRERHHHSLDTYGDQRYFELGRDATIEYGYLDVRFRNPHPHPVHVSVAADDSRVTAQVRAAVPRWFSVDIRVTPLTPPGAPPGAKDRIAVHTTRHLLNGETESIEDLGVSCYLVALAIPTRAG